MIQTGPRKKFLFRSLTKYEKSGLLSSTPRFAILQDIKKSFYKDCAFMIGMATIAAAFIALSVLVARTLNTFEIGRIVSASQMNENFQLLESRMASSVPNGFIGAFQAIYSEK